MQLQELWASLGVDLLSSIPLLVFLILGYLFTQTRTRSRKSTDSVPLKKKLQDETDEQTDATLSNAEGTPPSTPSAGQTLKKKGKRTRKAKEIDLQGSPEGSPVESVVPEAEGSPVEPVLTEAVPEVVPTADDVCGFMNWQKVEKKAEKRLAKQREQTQARELMEVLQVEAVPEQRELGTPQPDTMVALPEDTEQELPLDKREDDDSVRSTQPETDGMSEPLNLASQSTADQEQHYAAALALCEISTPDLTPRNLYNAATQWHGFEGQPEPQVESWVPVAIPMEYFQAATEGDAMSGAAPMHPTGIFDGVWQNTTNERIMIDGAELKFESGPVWTMKEQTFQGFIVEISGDEYRADLASGGQQLVWSDGDVWTCIAPLQRDQAPLLIPDASQLECMMSTAEMYMPAPLEMAHLEDVPSLAGAVPQNSAKDDAEDDWEVCWDWQKGWCKRGAACEWKHPVRHDWCDDTPFVGDVKQMKSSRMCRPCA